MCEYCIMLRSSIRQYFLYLHASCIFFIRDHNFFFVSRSKVKCSSETLVQSYIKRILAKDIEIRIG